MRLFIEVCRVTMRKIIITHGKAGSKHWLCSIIIMDQEVDNSLRKWHCDFLVISVI